MSPPATIPEALLDSAERGVGEYVFHLDDGPVRLSCEEAAERAQRGARRLRALGVEPGDAVGVLGPNRPEWVVAAFSTWLAGAAVVPVQIPLRIRDPEAFREQLRRLVDAGGCRRVLAEPGLTGLLPPGIGVSWEDAGEEAAEPPPLPAPESAAVIMFTSGSTAAPKGSLLTHAVVAAQIGILRDGYHHAGGAPREVVNWTPFFHDLGLFHNLVQAAFAGSTIHQLPTERFAVDPARWLRAIERTRASLTAAPSSAYGAAMRALARRGETVDLGSLEVTYFAAEGVDPDVVRRMLETGAELGLREETLGATYGLAEAGTVAYPPAGSGLRTDRISLPELASAGLAVSASEGPTRSIASSGPPLMELRVVGSGGGVLGEREVGEIHVCGPAVMAGYVGGNAPQPFVDGWLRTGDLGYLADGELFVTGRSKDLVIATGHNYYPEDFEWAAGRVDGVRPGRCVAFGMPGSEDVVILVENRDGEAAGLRREVTEAVANAVGVRPAEVVVLPPDTVEKTTSGKLRRAAMRDAYASGALPAGLP